MLEDFASEHQQQVDVQLDMESRTLSKPVGPAANNDEDGQPSADAGAAYIDDSTSSDDQEVELEEVAELEAAFVDGASSSNAAEQDVAQQNDGLKPGDTLH